VSFHSGGKEMGIFVRLVIGAVVIAVIAREVNRQRRQAEHEVQDEQDELQVQQIEPTQPQAQPAEAQPKTLTLPAAKRARLERTN
jgi:hypothetical protein